MPDAFDPYRKWLGIPVAEQPPNHYRLLAINLFEDDADVIESAADQRMAHVRTFQTGERSALSQRILNELSAAKLCLLKPSMKAAYDGELRRRLGSVKPDESPIPIAAPAYQEVEVGVRAEETPPFIADINPHAHLFPKHAPSVGHTAASRFALLAVAVPAAIFAGYKIYAKANSGRAERPLAAAHAIGEAKDDRLKRSNAADIPGDDTAAIWTAAEKGLDAPIAERSPSSAVNSRQPVGFGLKAELFADKEFKQLVKTRIDPNIDWFWAWSAPDDELPADGFSVRWSGWLKPPRPGKYKFAVIGDDGIRLSLNGTPLIDLWGNHLPLQNDATIELTAEPVAIQIEHYDQDASCLASWRWLPPGNSREEPVPGNVLFRDRESAERASVPAAIEDFDPVSNHGLSAEIYSGMNFESKIISRIDPDINFAWAQHGPAPDAPSDEFSVRWTGWLKPPRPGVYRISFVGDDGVRVSIGNHVVIDDWNAHFPTRVVGEVELPAHAVPICVEYFEVGLSAIASLRWSPPGTTAEELVPRECLFQTEPQNSAP
jgi:hypothetical protein